MKYQILFSTLLAGAFIASAQHVEIIEEKDGIPTGATTTMVATPDGRFHSGIVTLEGGNHRFFLNHSEGESTLRISPEGNKEFNPWQNDSYDYSSPTGTITSVPASRRISTVSAISDFDLWTDKAAYKPGQDVWIWASKYADYPDAVVRYRHGAEVIAEHPLVQEWWSWTPPATDYRGYLVDVYQLDADGNEQILGSIGVDISSDWKRFPRYGYTAWFGPEKEGGIEGDVAFLNRRHINAVQFQDWHWRHHRPYCPDNIYTDIFMKPVSKDVVKGLISAMHGYNMVTFFYNLGYGALDEDNAEEDGVKPEWYFFYDRNHEQKQCHYLEYGKSNIYFLNPANTEWQNYLCNRNDEVYTNLDFDGFQVDQIGMPAKDVFDYWGNQIWLHDGFAPLLQAFKHKNPSKRLIMNSVSNYGITEIASSGVVDVCYNELWDVHPMMTDLYKTIETNRQYGGHGMKTVFACYMNYGAEDENEKTPYYHGDTFNTPGVLLTDACMFALGASHLELGAGGNMLCNEYFPKTNLKVPDDLRDTMTRYYDFTTAYENYLYDTERMIVPTLTVRSDHKLSPWHDAKGPQGRHIVYHGKLTENGETVIHMLNFTSVNSLSWRDMDGSMPEPTHQTEISLDIDTDRMVNAVWVATPDSNSCLPVKLPYTQTGRTLHVTIPSLRYWTMLVIE